MKKEMNDDAPLLVHLKNWVQIGNAMFPKRDGQDYDNSFSSLCEYTGRRSLIFLMRDRVIEEGYGGENYKRGVVFDGTGYCDITLHIDFNEWRIHEGIYVSSAYKTADSPMNYAEHWGKMDLEGRQMLLKLRQ